MCTSVFSTEPPFMSFGQGCRMLKLVLNVKYLSLSSFLIAAEFYNLGNIQGIIRVT
jgi:hypothetical protein